MVSVKKENGSGVLAHCFSLYPFFIVAALEDAVHIYSRYVDMIGVEFAGLNQMLNFSDGNVTCLRHRR